MSNARMHKAAAEALPADATSGRRIVRPRKGSERVTLRSLREAMGKTQVEIAESLRTDQGEISRIERRADLRVSTLRRYAESLGARCEIVFVFDATGHRVAIAEPEGGGK